MNSIESWDAVRTPNWAVSELEAQAIFHIISEYDFSLPPEEAYWKDGLAQLLKILGRSPYPSLIPFIDLAYPRCNNDRRKCALLTLLGILATRESAEMLMKCVREHGWPKEAYSRLFEELYKLIPFGDMLLPDIILTAKKLSPSVGDIVITPISNDILKIDQLGDRIEGMAPFIMTSLRKTMKSAAKYQNKPGMAWRFSEKDYRVRHQTAIYFDLAGRLQDPKLVPFLREALTFKDPRLVTFATLSLLRREEKVAQKYLNVAASCHETRGILFHELRALKRKDLFPQQWRTWDAFAATKMVEWLLYPTELGREPDELKVGHVEWIDKKRKEVMYIWKFKTGKEPYLAGVSGPHRLQGKPEPFEGGSFTFSCFDQWDAATPLEHLEHCVGTVDQIREEVEN